MVDLYLTHRFRIKSMINRNNHGLIMDLINGIESTNQAIELLHYAISISIKKNKMNTLLILLYHPLVYKRSNNRTSTPWFENSLKTCIDGGSIKMFKFLFEIPCIRKLNKLDPLQYAIVKQRRNIIKYILNKKHPFDEMESCRLCLVYSPKIFPILVKNINIQSHRNTLYTTIRNTKQWQHADLLF